MPMLRAIVLMLGVLAVLALGQLAFQLYRFAQQGQVFEGGG